jgi:enoyl-CoA hydratase/carnithine racemase
MSHDVVLDDEGKTAEIVISGGAGNALDRAGIEELQRLLAEVAAQTQARSVILSGANSTFCGGRTRDSSLVTAAEIETDLAPILAMNRVMETYPLPLIAAVEGKAFGFGFGLATLCDVTIVADDARFALTELAHGIPPLIVLSYFFRFVPYKVAFDLALTGREISAAEAQRLGLATAVEPAGSTLSRARQIAAHIAQIDPEAMRLLRSYSRRNAALVDDTAATEGAAEIAAFLASAGSAG